MYHHSGGYINLGDDSAASMQPLQLLPTLMPFGLDASPRGGVIIGGQGDNGTQGTGRRLRCGGQLSEASALRQGGDRNGGSRRGRVDSSGGSPDDPIGRERGLQEAAPTAFRLPLYSPIPSFPAKLIFPPPRKARIRPRLTSGGARAGPGGGET